MNFISLETLEGLYQSGRALAAYNEVASNTPENAMSYEEWKRRTEEMEGKLTPDGEVERLDGELRSGLIRALSSSGIEMHRFREKAKGTNHLAVKASLEQTARANGWIIEFIEEPRPVDTFCIKVSDRNKNSVKLYVHPLLNTATIAGYSDDSEEREIPPSHLGKWGILFDKDQKLLLFLDSGIGDVDFMPSEDQSAFFEKALAAFH